MTVTACPLGARCHVEGKGLTRWGKSLPKAMVRVAAASSVQLVFDGRRVASGTLVWNNVVLCAAHSIANLDISKVSILLGYELKAPAPGGAENASRDSKGDTLPAWTEGSVLASQPQAQGVEVLELNIPIDFAFVRIRWNKVEETSYGQRFVRLPLAVEVPRAGAAVAKGDEVVLVGHPTDKKLQGEPTQASAGIVTLAIGPHHESLKGAEYTYASLGAVFGYSGGGVFNHKGEIVGVLIGGRQYDATTGAGGSCFVNLGLVAQRFEVVKLPPPVRATSARMRRWLGGGPPLLDQETREDVVLRGP